jgi:hypothetical protein
MAILAAFVVVSRTTAATCFAGIAVFLIGICAEKRHIVAARGLDKIVALTNLCFAIPLAVFGAEHLSGARLIMQTVPAYMPWRLFWAYFVGFALLAASLSIATGIALRWSGLLFGIMMFLFVAMIHFPAALADPHNRFPWTIVFREMSFGSAGWVLAGTAMSGANGAGKSGLVTVGRLLIALTAIFFSWQHFLHPLGLPGVPLPKEMPPWVPARPLIDYVTGAALLAAGICFLLNKKRRIVASWVGAWLLLMVLVIYGPVLIAALSDPSTAVQVEGINYFSDTLLFAAVILTVADTKRPD